MKTGDVYSYQKLRSLGWVPLFPFAKGILWAKDTKRILWSKITHTITEVFEDERYATW